MVRLLLIFLFPLLTLSAFTQEKKIPLTDWKFKPDLPKGHHLPSPTYPATVPGVVHLDMMQNGSAEDFYKKRNEHSYAAQSIEWGNWLYFTHFEMSAADLRNENVELVFEGLDTYAKVYVNGYLVLNANNMFRTWVIPLKDYAKAGKNELEVHFISPLNYHESAIIKAPYELPSGNETVDLKVSAYTRKAAYHFGWDWGPRFVTCGIWRPCYIRTWKDFRISDFYAETEKCDNYSAFMNIHFTINASQIKHASPFTAELMNHSVDFFIDQPAKKVTFPFKVENPERWYPNGHGDQYIYADTLLIKDSSGNCVHREPVRFAIRTIELVNEKDSIGTSFYFKVNDKPIFMKGANYIPQDMFLPRVTNEQTENLLDLVQESNMNMLRVWGGGIYESDFFYEQCDRRGILVWQDFMFANSMYPETPVFLETIAAEIEDNVKRLRNHPCIALWCGNNEIEVAWNNWGWQKQYGYSTKDSTEIWTNYKRIFHELIPDKLEELDPTRAYIPSSPQSNWGKKENFNHGAMHYWGVWHGKDPVENFKTNVGRFMVEYGFQSYPSVYLIHQYLDFDSSNFNSAQFKNLQKSYVGNGLIQREIETYFKNPLQFADWLEASQYLQAQALKTAIIAHRLKAPHCMGTLFWQLNDCWPGASWSVIDYAQEQKKAYVEVMKWFSPTIAVLEHENDSLKLTVHSDIAFTGEVTLTFFDDHSGEIFKQETIEFSLEALQTKQILTRSLRKWKKKYDFSGLAAEILINTSATDSIVFQDTFQFGKKKAG